MDQIQLKDTEDYKVKYPVERTFKKIVTKQGLVKYIVLVVSDLGHLLSSNPIQIKVEKPKEDDDNPWENRDDDQDDE